MLFVFLHSQIIHCIPQITYCFVSAISLWRHEAVFTNVRFAPFFCILFLICVWTDTERCMWWGGPYITTGTMLLVPSPVGDLWFVPNRWVLQPAPNTQSCGDPLGSAGHHRLAHTSRDRTAWLRGRHFLIFQDASTPPQRPWSQLDACLYLTLSGRHMTLPRLHSARLSFINKNSSLLFQEHSFFF